MADTEHDLTLRIGDLREGIRLDRLTIADNSISREERVQTRAVIDGKTALLRKLLAQRDKAQGKDVPPHEL